MTWRLWIPLGVAVALAGAVRADAQGVVPKRPEVKVEIPRTLRPPPGMCRVWVENVPARQQPAPTDCPTAIRNRPPNGRVIFSDEKPPSVKAKGGAKADSAKGPKKPEVRPPAERAPSDEDRIA